MKNVRLVEPSLTYQDSFLDFVEDVKMTGYESYELYLKAEVDFAAFVTDLIDASKGINIEEGWAPFSSYWLVDDGGEVIGVIRVRHRVDTEQLLTAGHIGYEIKSSHRKKGYGTKMLELGLMEAQKMGLEKVLINCSDANLGSMRMIEKFGGKYKQSIMDPESGENLLQYEVTTI